MLKKTTTIFPVLFFALVSVAQKPAISKQDLKPKLIAISKAFPDIKKSLTKKDPYNSDKLVPKIAIGDFDGKFKENGEKKYLEYQFSSSLYAGTQDEFKAFYEKTVQTIKELFAAKYDPSEMDPTDSELSTHFYEKGKEFKSDTWMAVRFWWTKSSMYVYISFYGK